jgi:hypothetical protein
VSVPSTPVVVTGSVSCDCNCVFCTYCSTLLVLRTSARMSVKIGNETVTALGHNTVTIGFMPMIPYGVRNTHVNVSKSKPH